MSKFEIDVLAQIDRCLYDTRTGRMIPAIAKFFSGTLFVRCSEDTARKIFHTLSKEHGLGCVRISKAGDEYAIDFI